MRNEIISILPMGRLLACLRHGLPIVGVPAHLHSVDGPEGRYPCQSLTGALRSLLPVGFELA